MALLAEMNIGAAALYFLGIFGGRCGRVKMVFLLDT
jgi:hypothetical protein